MHVLVIYDISNSKKRRGVVKLLNRYGTRVQKSAFECIITEAMAAKLEQKLAAGIDKTDSVRIYRFLSGTKIKSFGLETEEIYDADSYLII